VSYRRTFFPNFLKLTNSVLSGGGSILHHLMAFGGKQDPLFRKAILQSPAFQALYDRSGVLETTFQNFSAQAGCGGRGLACLRQANVNDLSKASAAIIAGAPPGTFGFG